MRSPESLSSDIDIKACRLGFLGLGWIGRHRMNALLSSNKISSIAFMEPLPENAEEALKLAPHAIVCDTFEDMLHENIDGVVIATPSALHAQQTIKALDAGKAVFCQKPLARTAMETLAVIHTACRNDRLLGVDFSYRFMVGSKIMKKLIDTNDIGEIFAIDCMFHNAYGPDKQWFYDPKRSGGGCVIDLGIHLIDMVLWLFDFREVKNITSNLYANGRILDRPNDECVEDYAHINFTLDSTVSVRTACSWRLSAGQDAVIAITLYGTNGGLSMYNLNGSFFDFRTERFRGTQREVLQEYPDDWGGGAALDWLDSLIYNNRYDASAARLVDVAKIIDKVYQFRDGYNER